MNRFLRTHKGIRTGFSFLASCDFKIRLIKMSGMLMWHFLVHERVLRNRVSWGTSKTVPIEIIQM